MTAAAATTAPVTTREDPEEDARAVEQALAAPVLFAKQLLLTVKSLSAAAPLHHVYNNANKDSQLTQLRDRAAALQGAPVPLAKSIATALDKLEARLFATPPIAVSDDAEIMLADGTRVAFTLAPTSGDLAGLQTDKSLVSKLKTPAIRAVGHGEHTVVALESPHLLHVLAEPRRRKTILASCTLTLDAAATAVSVNCRGELCAAVAGDQIHLFALSAAPTRIDNSMVALASAPVLPLVPFLSWSKLHPNMLYTVQTRLLAGPGLQGSSQPAAQAASCECEIVLYEYTASSLVRTDRAVIDVSAPVAVAARDASETRLALACDDGRVYLVAEDASSILTWQSADVAVGAPVSLTWHPSDAFLVMVTLSGRVYFLDRALQPVALIRNRETPVVSLDLVAHLSYIARVRFATWCRSDVLFLVLDRGPVASVHLIEPPTSPLALLRRYLADARWSSAHRLLASTLSTPQHVPCVHAFLAATLALSADANAASIVTRVFRALEPRLLLRPRATELKPVVLLLRTHALRFLRAGLLDPAFLIVGALRDDQDLVTAARRWAAIHADPAFQSYAMSLAAHPEDLPAAETASAAVSAAALERLHALPAESLAQADARQLGVWLEMTGRAREAQQLYRRLGMTPELERVESILVALQLADQRHYHVSFRSSSSSSSF